MEHNDNVVHGTVDVCQHGYGRKGVCANTRKIPLSMPSAPSRMAASKLASVFSGNREDAFGTMSTPDRVHGFV
jgi:hypothetical protein